jgi:hypothetical protein
MLQVSKHSKCNKPKDHSHSDEYKQLTNVQHTLAVREGYVLENPREQENRDVRSSDLMGKMRLGEPSTHET